MPEPARQVIGRPVLIGMLISLLASGMFSFIARQALSNSRLVELDKSIARDFWAASAKHTVLRSVMVVLTESGGIAAMTILAVVGVFWQAWRGRGKARVAIGWALIVIGGAILNQVVKTALDRERPPAEWRDPAVTETNESFPSGHSMGATIGIGLLAYVLMLKDRHWRSRLFLIVLLGGWVLSIGMSRVYLRAHWFSDVLGGFALGLAWLSLGLGLLETWRRQGPRQDSRVCIK